MRTSVAQSSSSDDGEQLLTDSFDRRTMMDMEVALDKACRSLPSDLNTHESRTRIAKKIIGRVREGSATQGNMISVGLSAAEMLKSEASRKKPA